MADEHPHRASHAAKANQEKAEASTEVETRQGELEEPPPPPLGMISPYELPANTVAAQAYLINNPGVMDERIVLEDDRVTAAQNEIELYGHPEDPRITGGSLLESPVPPEKLAAPGERKIEMPEIEDRGWATWGEFQGAETEEEVKA